MATQVFVTLKNRSDRTLIGTWDGRQHTFPPGYEGKWPELIALKFKEQNPIMGTEDYFTGYKQYLMGIVEHGDDLDPITQNDSAVEKWDRTTLVLPPGTKLETIRGRGYHPIQDRTAGLPAQAAKVESFEPTPGFGDTETVTIADPDFKP